MSELNQEKCTACRADAPKATDEEIQNLSKEIPDWSVVQNDRIPQLQRAYEFADFVKAMGFTQRVADLAEEEGHHPALLTEWGRVTVRWWTHKIKGLHRNDFVMAAKTDGLYA